LVSAVRGSIPCMSVTDLHCGCRCTCGLVEPVLEARLAKSSAFTWHERVLAELRADVPRVRIGNHLAWIAACAEAATNKVVETKAFWTAQLHGGKLRRRDSNVA
jgi:hypothetical protein